MLVLGGLGEMWLYPNEVIGNDVQDEGWGLFYQYSGAQKCDFCAPLSMISINYIIKKYTGDTLLFRIWLSKRCVHVLGGHNEVGGYNESEPTMKISFSRNSWSNCFYIPDCVDFFLVNFNLFEIRNKKRLRTRDHTSSTAKSGIKRIPPYNKHPSRSQLSACDKIISEAIKWALVRLWNYVLRNNRSWFLSK